MPTFKTKPVKEAKKRQPRETGESIDYKKLPGIVMLTENEFYNWQVFGQKTVPKSH